MNLKQNLITHIAVVSHLFTSSFMSVTEHAVFNLADTSFSLRCGFELNSKTSGTINKSYFALLHLANYQYCSETVGGDMGFYKHTLNKQAVSVFILKSRIIHSLG